MLFNPEDIVKQGIISGPYKVQTNAIDFTLDDLFNIDNQISYISNNKSIITHQARIRAPLLDAELIRRNYLLPNAPEREADEPRLAGWVLQPNTSYDGASNVYVEVPEGMAAFLIVRSTLNRNAIRLTSGLYDSGFKGHIGFVLHNGVGETFIEQGTYVGQICFIESKNAALYSGGYNTEKGQHWTESKVEVKVEAKVEPKVEVQAELIADVDILEEVTIEAVDATSTPKTTRRRTR